MGRYRTGVNKIKKLYSMDKMTAQMIKEDAERIGISQSAAIAEMIIKGYRQFRKDHRLDDFSTNSMEGISDGEIGKSCRKLSAKELLKLKREKREKDFEKARKQRLHDIIFKYKPKNPFVHEDDGWEEDGR